LESDKIVPVYILTIYIFLKIVRCFRVNYKKINIKSVKF
jgi:hypothetical protein